MALVSPCLADDVLRPCRKVIIERNALRVGLALEGCQVCRRHAFSNCCNAAFMKFSGAALHRDTSHKTGKGCRAARAMPATAGGSRKPICGLSAASCSAPRRQSVCVSSAAAVASRGVSPRWPRRRKPPAPGQGLRLRGCGRLRLVFALVTVAIRDLRPYRLAVEQTHDD